MAWAVRSKGHGNHYSQLTGHCSFSGVRAEKCQHHHRILPPISSSAALPNHDDHVISNLRKHVEICGSGTPYTLAAYGVASVTHAHESLLYQPGVWYATMESTATAMSVLRAFLRNQGKQNLSYSAEFVSQAW